MTVAIAMLTVGSLVVIWRPLTMPLPLQYLAIATVLAVIEIAPFEGPYIFFVVVPLVVVVAAYPEPELNEPPSGRFDQPSAAGARFAGHGRAAPGSVRAPRFRSRAVTG